MDDLEAYILEIYGFLATTLATGLYGNFNESANNDLCSLTPIKDAFHKHLPRSCYQGGYLWLQFLEEIDVPDTGDI